MAGLYALAFRVATNDLAYATQEGRQALAEAAGRYARAAERRFRRAIETGAARVGAEDANTLLQVTDLQLDGEGLMAFNRLFGEFISAVRPSASQKRRRRRR